MQKSSLPGRSVYFVVFRLSSGKMLDIFNSGQWCRWCIYINMIKFLIQLHSEKSKITIAWIRDFAGPSKLHDKLDRNSSETNIDTCFFSQQISRRVTLIYYSSCTGSFRASIHWSVNFIFLAQQIHWLSRIQCCVFSCTLTLTFTLTLAIQNKLLDMCIVQAGQI